MLTNSNTRRISILVILFVAIIIFVGCAGGPAAPASTQPVELNLATTQPWYWLNQPGVVAVSDPDFKKLWDSCENVIRKLQFRIDRMDYRSGVLTTEPTVSRQFYELWRNDGPSSYDVQEASLAQIRRTIYFQFTHDEDGGYTVTPKVLVERFATVEAKLRTTLDYDPMYWYPLRRDNPMEKNVAAMVKKQLASN